MTQQIIKFVYVKHLQFLLYTFTLKVFHFRLSFKKIYLIFKTMKSYFENLKTFQNFIIKLLFCDVKTYFENYMNVE